MEILVKKNRLRVVEERKEISHRVKVLRLAAVTLRKRLQRRADVEPEPISCELETIEQNGGEITRLLVEGRSLGEF